MIKFFAIKSLKTTFWVKFSQSFLFQVLITISFSIEDKEHLEEIGQLPFSNGTTPFIKKKTISQSSYSTAFLQNEIL